MRSRRGSALILVLLMTLAVAGLAAAAIFMSSSANLLSRFYDREREFRLATESALDQVRSRLLVDPAFAVPDTGVAQVLAGQQILTATGTPVPRVLVNVFAATTGDTTGLTTPHVTLVAAAYDAGGTRHVRRMDLRRESFARYQLFADSFPSGQAFGPGAVAGRVHTNAVWRTGGTGAVYLDTVSAAGGITGSATFEVDSLPGARPVFYPRDSTFARLDTLAAAGNLAFTPVSGTGRGTRLEFVAFDGDGNGRVGPDEGFVRVFDLAAGFDTTRLKAAPVVRSGFLGFSVATLYAYDDPIIQKQCGAFYLRGGRWHFFPVETHRTGWARTLIEQTGGGAYPGVSSGQMSQLNDFDVNAVVQILVYTPTARCFPAGSPYLMPTERMTNALGVVTGTAADTVPFGVVPPAGGVRGGSDTTFTPRSRTCRLLSVAWDHPNSGRCASGTHADLGTWRAFGGSAVTGIASTIRQAPELPFLWPLAPSRNAASRGVISARGGPLFLSGDVRGAVTLRVDGRAMVIDRVRLVGAPADPDAAPCEDQLGLLAVGDVLVAEGLVSRVRRVGQLVGPFVVASESMRPGAEPGFTLAAHLMSLTGTVGVENPGTTMGASGDQLRCPVGDAAAPTSNGGCLAVTGGLIMQSFTAASALYGSTPNSGFRFGGTPHRCQRTDGRPPFFPLTNRYRFVRSLEIAPVQANTPAKVRALLMRLKGVPL